MAPRSPAEADPPDPGMTGFPQNGDPHEPVVEDDPPDPERREPDPPADPLADIKAQLADVKRRNEELERRLPPAQPKQQATPPPEDDPEPDYEKLLFADPKQALKLHGERIAKQVTKELTAQYQKDRGTSEFWNRFYAANPDLRTDSDLVEVTLNSNLADLANIRVEDAYVRLAELTRERILRYAGGAAKERRPKARAEGAGRGPSPPPAPPPSDTTVTRLSDVLRTRRQGRRKAGAA